MRHRLSTWILVILGIMAGLTKLASADTAIDLDQADGQVLIEEAGVYTLTGHLDGSVLIDAGEGDVTLILDGAVIESSGTAGITAVSGSSLTIQLADGTENTVSDGGSDEDYDAAVFSQIPLTFDGTGSLTVLGNNQEGISTENADLTFLNGVYTVASLDDGIGAGGDDGGTLTFLGGTFYINASGDGIDSNASILFAGGSIYVIGSAQGGDAGIDSDGGYVITGGSIVALGTDMLEAPASGTTQCTLAVTLDESVAEGSQVVLRSEDGTEIVSFTADQAFRTLVISNDQMNTGNYTLLVNGTAVSIGGQETLALTDTVTAVGSMMPMSEGMFPGEPPKGMPGDGSFPEPPDGTFGGGNPPEMPEGMVDGAVPPERPEVGSTPPPRPGESSEDTAGSADSVTDQP